jgi:hypothetical protein
MMKQFKREFALLWFLCIFALNGCVGSSGSSGSTSPKVGVDNSQNHVAAVNSPDAPLITSFTLWGTKDDVNTAIAGEIIGNNITVQVPSDTTFPLQIIASFRNIDPDGKDITTISVPTKYGPQPITNDTPQLFNENFPNNYTVATNNGEALYTITVVKRAAYFTKYADTICIRDFDGNIWYKFMDPNNWVSWSIAVSHAEQLNAGYFKTGTCGLTSNWGLPSKSQMQLMINYLPLDNRKNPTQIGGISPEATWFNSQGFMVSGFNLWGQSDESDNTKAYVWNLDGVTYHQTPLGISTVDKNSTNMVVSTWFVNSTNKNDAKTITDFSVNGQSALIVGNQIILNTTFIRYNDETSFKFGFTSTNGGTVNINNAVYINGSAVTFSDKFIGQPQTEIIPVTIISNNGDKNIYTLVLHLVPPTPTPVEPTALYICMASDSMNNPPNKTVVATMGNHIYKNQLPEPGSCGTVSLGSTTFQDLENNPVVWWSTSDMEALGATNFLSAAQQDTIPTFEWQADDNSPYGYSLSVEMKPNCKHDSSTPSGFSSDCFAPNQPFSRGKETASGIKICAQTDGDQQDPGYLSTLFSEVYYGFNINEQQFTSWFNMPAVTDLNKDSCQTVPLSGSGSYMLAKYAGMSTVNLSPQRSDVGTSPEFENLKSIPIQLDMVAETKYCQWKTQWSRIQYPLYIEYTVTPTMDCQFPVFNHGLSK